MDVKPKKRFGQNFLVHTQILNRINDSIAELVSKYQSYSIIEVGPGTGQLTEILLQYASVTAIEIDPEAAAFVQNRFQENANFTLIQGDAQKILFSEKGLFTSTHSLCISNLPFNVGSRILVDLAMVRPAVPFLVIVQKEVALKPFPISSLTLFGAWLAFNWHLEKCFDIPPHAFEPQPRVTSAVLRGIPRKNFIRSQEQTLPVFQLLKTMFAHPRKTLVHNLVAAGWDRTRCEDILRQNQIDSKIRLTWDNYEDILELLHDQLNQ